MKNLLTFFLLFWMVSVFGQVPQIMLHSPVSGTVTPYGLDFATALSDATFGDTLYLPGGTIGGNHTINVRVHIIGAGFHPDSTSATLPTTMGAITFDGLSEKSSISGVYLAGLTIRADSDSMLVTRNYLGGSCSIAGTGTKVIDNVVPEATGSGSGNWFQSNVIRNGGINDKISATDCYFYNNLFLCDSRNIRGSILKNNIISVGLNGFTGCHFEKNLFDTYIGLPGSNNVNGGDEADQYFPHAFNAVMVDLSTNYYTADYHINPNYPGVATFLGDDGTHVGIYGGSRPSKVGWMPTNPHIFFKEIADELNPDGTLPVKVKVSGQGY